jgi:hypothetical protein
METLFCCCSLARVLLPVLSGMAVSLLTLIPPLRRWGQGGYQRTAITLICALLATLVFEPSWAYGSVTTEIFISSVSTLTEDKLGGYRDAVARELWVRKIIPPLSTEFCYTAQENICRLADDAEYSKTNLANYLLSLGITFFFALFGSFAVIALTNSKRSGTPWRDESLRNGGTTR